MRIDAPWLTDATAKAACGFLSDAGYSAYFVGGCVRNALLGEPVSDLDIATNARPDTVMELAGRAGLRAIPTGVEHGTITVLVEDQPFEITTYRRDVATDGRRAVVAFADDIEQDARRRDFTMNALYADPNGEVLDPLGGLPDLLARQVRFIEDPEQRIREDYLRILRFFRFHAWYGDPLVGIDAEGLAACAGQADGIAQLSAERIGSEMLKLLAAPDPGPAVAAMAASGVLMRVLRGAQSDLIPVLVDIEQAADLSIDPLRRLAALGGEDLAGRLRLTRQQAARLGWLRSDMSAPELSYRYGADVGLDRLALDAASAGRHIGQTDIAVVMAGASRDCPVRAADLPDLQGAALGAALKEAESRWIASGFTLTKAELLR